MTYLDLFTDLVDRAFPEGLASNLYRKIDGELKTVLVELQGLVPWMQDRQWETFETGDRLWKCGATFVPITIETIVTDVIIRNEEEPCRRATVRPVTKRIMDELLGAPCGLLEPEGAADADGYYPDQDGGLETVCDFQVAVMGDKVAIYPQLHPLQSLQVQWTGIRRYWLSGTTIPTSWLVAVPAGSPNGSVAQIDPTLGSALTAYFENVRSLALCDGKDDVGALYRYRDRVRDMISDKNREDQRRIDLQNNIYASCYACS